MPINTSYGIFVLNMYIFFYFILCKGTFFIEKENRAILIEYVLFIFQEWPKPTMHTSVHLFALHHHHLLTFI